MRAYDKQLRFVNIGRSLNPFLKADLPFFYWANIGLIANPRFGKSAIAKHFVCKVSKFRKTCIFDYSGEWCKDVFLYNPRSWYPDKLVNALVINDLVFKVSDFTNPSDFISLGFTPDGANFLSVCARAVKFHHNNVEMLIKLIQDLPTSSDYVDDFNYRYGQYGITIDYRMSEATKMSLLNHFYFIKEWFWKGNMDSRKTYNLNKLWRYYDHLIINLSSGDSGTNENYAQAYVGKILEKLRPYFSVHKPLFVFEEARFLAPRLDGSPDFLKPSSLQQIENLATVDPKKGVAILWIAQSESMIARKIVDHAYVRLIGTTEDRGVPFEIARSMVRWIPENNYRTMIMYQANRKWVHFEPSIPCCAVGAGGGL